MDDVTVPLGCECPRCGCDEVDRLIWDMDCETVECSRCNMVYVPLGSSGTSEPLPIIRIAE